MIQDSIFYTGLMKLIQDLGRAIAIISPILAGAVVAYCFVRRSASDEMDHKKWSSRITVTIISGIGGALGGTIISVIGSYFGVR